MIPAPNNVAELSQILVGANSRKEKIERVDLSKINRVLEHTPGDMTATVETGITLAEFQRQIGKYGQWLAIDPPHPENATIAEVISTNASGPRRFGCGTIRDYLIGLTAVLADGTIIHSGGKVVKNVAGYDLMKLFIGGQGTVGVVVEATFKLRPLPEAEQFISTTCKTLDDADKLIEAVLKSPITPLVLDLYKLSTNEPLKLVLGFAGSREEVEWQMAHVGELGFNESASLDYEKKFWSDAAPAHRLSVLPSKLVEAIRGLDGAPFVARAGNGIIYHRGTTKPPAEKLPLELMRRIKDAYDPNHIFPELPL